MNAPARPQSRLFYGYIVVGAAFLIQIITWGTFNSFGVFFNALLDEFNWTYAAIAGAASLSQFLVGIGAVFMGRLNDRFGPRLLMMFCAVTVGLGFFLTQYTSNPWHLYVFQGLIVGFGISGTDVVLLSTTARWFKRRRGIMSGMVKIGTGVGTMIMPLIITALIGAYGWRTSYAVVGIAIFLLVIVVAQALRRDPARMGLMPDGVPVVTMTDVHKAETGMSFREALATRPFWMLSLVFFAAFFCTFSMIVHFAPASVDLGNSQTFAAGMVSLIGGASIIGRFFMGVTNDKIGSHRSLVAILIVFTAAYIWLQFAGAGWSLIVFAVVYGVCHGGFYTVMSPVVADFFGMRSHGLILGIMVFSGSVGGALGPFIIGRMYDATGSYDGPFLLLLALVAVGLLAVFGTGKPKPEDLPSGPQAFTGGG